jgi:hypothetical protein
MLHIYFWAQGMGPKPKTCKHAAHGRLYPIRARYMGAPDQNGLGKISLNHTAVTDTHHHLTSRLHAGHNLSSTRIYQFIRKLRPNPVSSAPYKHLQKASLTRGQLHTSYSTIIYTLYPYSRGGTTSHYQHVLSFCRS